MSGICGVVYKDGRPVGDESVRAMLENLKDWGRDRSSAWMGGGAGLGHALLINTPEAELERQPYEDADCGLIITADARLDNREELQEALRIPASEGEELSDDRLILLAYTRWGPAALDRLVGAFALGIWDPGSRELFVARDHLGCRSLYYHDSPQCFAFATDPAALLVLDGVDDTLDGLALAATVLQGYHYLREHSFYRAVAKLPPGHALRLQNGSVKLLRYWAPEALAPLPPRPLEEYDREFGVLLKTVVSAQLRTRRGVGSHLSGGLDSSGIAVMAHRELCSRGGALAAGFSWSPASESATRSPKDEHHRIHLIADPEGISVVYLELDPGDVAGVLARNPLRDPTETLVHESVVCRVAAEQGIGVMLSGWGGDEFASVNGRGFWSDLFRRGSWGQLIAEASRRTPLGGRRSLRNIAGEIAVTSVPDRLYFGLGLDLPSMLRGRIGRRRIRALLTPAELGLRRAHAVQGRVRPGVRRNMLRLLQLGHLQRRMEDWALEGARRGVDYRFPLLDRRVVEFCLSVPPAVHVRHGMNRCLLRQAFTALLPSEISWSATKSEPVKISEQQRMFRAGSALPATAGHAGDGVQPEVARLWELYRLRLQVMGLAP